jgi:hypothetical protein
MIFSDEQKLQICLREIKKREWVYSGQVTKGKMSQAQMNYEIEGMKAIADDYRKKVEEGRLI